MKTPSLLMLTLLSMSCISHALGESNVISETLQECRTNNGLIELTSQQYMQDLAKENVIDACSYSDYSQENKSLCEKNVTCSSTNKRHPILDTSIRICSMSFGRYDPYYKRGTIPINDYTSDFLVNIIEMPGGNETEMFKSQAYNIITSERSPYIKYENYVTKIRTDLECRNTSIAQYLMYDEKMNWSSDAYKLFLTDSRIRRLVNNDSGSFKYVERKLGGNASVYKASFISNSVKDLLLKLTEPAQTSIITRSLIPTLYFTISPSIVERDNTPVRYSWSSTDRNVSVVGTVTIDGTCNFAKGKPRTSTWDFVNGFGSAERDYFISQEEHGGCSYQYCLTSMKNGAKLGQPVCRSLSVQAKSKGRGDDKNDRDDRNDRDRDRGRPGRGGPGGRGYDYYGR